MSDDMVSVVTLEVVKKNGSMANNNNGKNQHILGTVKPVKT